MSAITPSKIKASIPDAKSRFFLSRNVNGLRDSCKIYRREISSGHNAFARLGGSAQGEIAGKGARRAEIFRPEHGLPIGVSAAP